MNESNDGYALELNGVIAGYGRIMILNGTSFGVHAGAITTVIGPNGAGKSTVFKTAFGMLPVRQGSISFYGQDITNWKPRRLLDNGVAYVPQGRNIFPELTVRHNLELGGWSLRKEVNLEQRVEAVADRFSMLHKKMDRQASTLSGGEQKTLEIARALLLEPRVLLVDEPSIGLSPLMVKDLFELLHTLRDDGVTILMVEQNARTALANSDYAIVLEQGRTRLSDTADTVLNNPKIGQLLLGGAIEEEVPS